MSLASRLLGLALPLVLAAAPVRAEIDRSQLLGMAASVLKIEAHRRQGGYALGSGVVLGGERVVTNCHVTRDSSEVYVLRGDVRWRAQAQVVDALHDLCLLRVPGIAAVAVGVGSSRALKPGQAVTAVGYTGGLGIQSSAGNVVALHVLDGGKVVQSTNWFTSGASGGALFDDELNLVGVLTFRLLGGEGHYFAAPAEWLAPLLSDAAVFVPIAPLAATALAYWQLPADRQPNFLQAVTLTRDRKWQELEALALRWSAADRHDAAPLMLQGLALDRLDRLPEAEQAIDRALALEPGSAEAWYRLGLVSARRGDRVRARQARDRLQLLDPAQARELDAAIGKT
jgi:hypothetical protein